jgi:hypothetical protein
MGQVIYKYNLGNPLPNNRLTVVLSLPQGWKARKVASQGGEVKLWAQHLTTDYTTDNYEFLVIGTGVRLPDVEDPAIEEWKFIDTAFIGDYVWHVFVKRLRGSKG